MIQPGYSFTYDKEAVQWVAADTQDICAALTLKGSLRVDCRRRPLEGFDEAAAWRLALENTGKEDTAVIADLYDCDVTLPLRKDAPRPLYRHITDEYARIVLENGCGHGLGYSYDDEGSADEFRLRSRYIKPGETFECTNGKDGRSSSGLMPFVDINHGEDGYILAVGWTGSWRVSITRGEDTVRIRAGLAHTRFRMQSGERFETASILILPYRNGQINARNRFRRLIRQHYSIVGQPGRPAHAMLALEGWGGLSSDEMIHRIQRVNAAGARFDHYWIDAGWYGDSEVPCLDPQTGNWGAQAGNWYVNPHYHPDGLQDVVRAVENAGMTLMLWFEPERAVVESTLVQAHPEWFLEYPDADLNNPNRSVMLNLALEEAYTYCLDMLAGFIETLHITCYRQDFNVAPAPVWEKVNPPDRVGVLEIRHINNLYRLWDALLDRFPGLCIDNCASGGNRIDIESLRRSVPFFRSDFQCGVNGKGDVTQAHHAGISTYLPYTGCTTKVNDTYTARSAYAAAWGTGGLFASYSHMTDAELAWLSGIVEEYRAIRAYIPCDFYPMAGSRYEETAWAAWQYDRPETGDGILMAFRRACSPLCTGCFQLHGIKADVDYEIYDRDSGSRTRIGGATLLRDGLAVTMPEPRSSRIVHYRKL